MHHVLILGPSSRDCMDREMHCLFAEKDEIRVEEGIRGNVSALGNVLPQAPWESV